MKKLLFLVCLAITTAGVAQSAPSCPNFSAAKVISAARVPTAGITVISAHRGYWEFVPENSTMAVQAAVNACIEMSEIDVRLTKDKEPVLQHDVSVERTTTGVGYINDLCYQNVGSLCSGVSTNAYASLSFKDRHSQTYLDPSTKQPVPVQSLDDFLHIMLSDPNLIVVIDAKDQGPYVGSAPTSYQTMLAAWSDIKTWEIRNSTFVRNRIIWKMRINEIPADPNQLNSDMGFCSKSTQQISTTSQAKQTALGTAGTSTGSVAPPPPPPPCPIAAGQGVNNGVLTAANSDFSLVPIWYSNDPSSVSATLCTYNNYLGGTNTTCGIASPVVATGYLWNPEVSVNTPGSVLNPTLVAYLQTSGQNVTSFVPASDWAEGMSQATADCCRYRYSLPFPIDKLPPTLPTPPAGQGPVQYTGDPDYVYFYGGYNWISGDHVPDISAYLIGRGQRNTALISQ